MPIKLAKPDAEPARWCVGEEYDIVFSADLAMLFRLAASRAAAQGWMVDSLPFRHNDEWALWLWRFK